MTGALISRPLTDLLAVAFGPLPVLTDLLTRAGGVTAAFIYGSWAARYLGEPGPIPHDVDVLVVGAADRDDLEEIARTAQDRLGRPVNIRRISPAAAVLQAALALLAERGYEATTLPDIARRAGVHPATVYRRWHTKPGLLTDAMLEYAAETIPAPNTGSLRGDLEQLLRQVVGILAQEPVRALLRGVVAEAARGSATVAAERTRYWQERFARAAVIVDRAAERGELGAEVDPDALIENLIAAAYLRALITGRDLDDAFIKAQVSNMIAAFAPDRPARP